MIRIGVCDDARETCTQLKKMILSFQEQVNEKIVVDVFYTGKDLLDFIQEEYSFHIVFLGIKVDNGDGIEIGKAIRHEMGDLITKIVFLSSAVPKGTAMFDALPLHCLYKPLNQSKVFEVVSIALDMFSKDGYSFSFKTGHQINKILIQDILYFKNDGRLIDLISTRETYSFYGTMNLIAQKLQEARFVQPHRSYLINFAHVATISSNKMIMSNGMELPISRGRWKEMQKLFIELGKFEEY